VHRSLHPYMVYPRLAICLLLFAVSCPFHCHCHIFEATANVTYFHVVYVNSVFKKTRIFHSHEELDTGHGPHLKITLNERVDTDRVTAIMLLFTTLTTCLIIALYLIFRTAKRIIMAFRCDAILLQRDHAYV
jgi:hypothetical protein